MTAATNGLANEVPLHFAQPSNVGCPGKCTKVLTTSTPGAQRSIQCPKLLNRARLVRPSLES